MSKIMNVFYAADCLPYKDKERQVHYPIVGQGFQGASNTTEIKFYIDQIGVVDGSWVAIAKLPNGKVGSKLLSESEEDENGRYVSLELSSFYTQYVGSLFISLQGYQGGVEVEYDSETELYVIHGTPTIEATGPIKLAINYSTQYNGSDENEQITVQEALAIVSTKLDKNSPKYFKVVNKLTDLASDEYADFLNVGDIFYCKEETGFYRITALTPTPTYERINARFDDLTAYGNFAVQGDTELQYLDVYSGAEFYDDVNFDKNINVANTIFITNFDYIEDGNGTTLVDKLNEKQNQIPVIALASLGGTISPSSLLDSLAVFPSYLTYEYGGDKSVFIHCRTDSTYYYFRKLFKESIHDNTSYLIYGGDIYIQVNKTTGAYSQQSVQHTWYSKSEADELLNLKADKSDTYTKSEIDTKLTSMLVYKGSKTVAELNALSLGETQTGWFYNVTDSGVLNAGNVEVLAGDNVTWTGSSWDKLTMDLSAYDDKFIAAGFFEVQDYNEEEGTITFVYASDLYSMNYGTYDSDIGAYVSDTGILTIEAN